MHSCANASKRVCSAPVEKKRDKDGKKLKKERTVWQKKAGEEGEGDEGEEYACPAIGIMDA